MDWRRTPWTDPGGRFEPLKTVVFIALFLPAIWVFSRYEMGELGARPLNEAIHQIGSWAIRLLFLSLAVTPMRETLRWSRLALVRRMIGVGAFAYVLIHLTLYIGDQAFDLAKVATEIALRIYLTIGFVALLGLSALAATSTDAMTRRLGGRRWRKLHRLVYGIAVLAVIHHFMQSKANVIEPLVMAGLLFWLLAYRVLAAWRPRQVPLVLLGAGAGLLTALGEAVYYALKTGAPMLLVLSANLDTAAGVRPAWIVWGVGALVVVFAWARGLADRTLRIWRAREASG
jgi:sulfoxide reductase heme-binding subunit YedZ